MKVQKMVSLVLSLQELNEGKATRQQTLQQFYVQRCMPLNTLPVNYLTAPECITAGKIRRYTSEPLVSTSQIRTKKKKRELQLPPPEKTATLLPLPFRKTASVSGLTRIAHINTRENLTREQARRLDPMSYVEVQGYDLRCISRSGRWNIIPGKGERTHSWRVDRELHPCYNHGFGKGGPTLNCVYFTLPAPSAKRLRGCLELRLPLSFHPANQQILQPMTGLKPEPSSCQGQQCAFKGSVFVSEKTKGGGPSTCIFSCWKADVRGRKAKN